MKRFLETKMIAVILFVALALGMAPTATAFVLAPFTTQSIRAFGSGPLWSTTEKEEDQTQHPKSHLSKTPKARISIAPLGTNQGSVDPLKTFPTFEMKERFRKIRSPRKKKDAPKEEEKPTQVPDCPPLLFGNGEFFPTDKLVQMLHETADVGNPLESTRTLADQIPLDGGGDSLSCGSSSCTRGGWPSKTPSTHAKVFFLLNGFGCLTDMDGKRNYFGPGDTVIVPKHWAGRWDVAEDLHKIWFQLDYESTADEKEEDEKEEEDMDVDDANEVVRAKVIHYHELVKWSFRHTREEESETFADANDDPHKSETIFETPEDLGLGLSCITCFSPSEAVPFVVGPRKFVDCFHILEGSMVLTAAGATKDEPSFAFSSGDTVVLPKGWNGTCHIKDAVKALRVRA